MENTCTTPTENPSPPNPQLDQVREMADALLQAFKAAAVPKDHAGIGTAARTLISLTRLIKALSGDRAAPKRRQPPSPLDIEAATDAVETDSDPIPALNRQQRRREDKFRRSVKRSDRLAVALSP